jgi:hypothetical protein
MTTKRAELKATRERLARLAGEGLISADTARRMYLEALQSTLEASNNTTEG